MLVRDNVFTLLGTHSSVERSEHDFYATDPKALEMLLKKETPNHLVWECASGKGHLVNVLRAHGHEVLSTDIVDRGVQDKLVDFLEFNGKWQGDIVTNPPFKYAEAFIKKALEVCEGNIYMFVRLQLLEGQSRYNNIYKNTPPTKVYCFPKRVYCPKEGEGFDKSSAIAYAWLIWERNSDNHTTTLGWLTEDLLSHSDQEN